MTDYLLKDELLNTDLLFGQFWEISVEGMRLTDETGKILLVNDSFCKVYQMSDHGL